MFKYCTLFLESDFGANAEIVFMLREDPKDRALTTIPLKSQLYWTSRSFHAQPNTCVVLVRVSMAFEPYTSFHSCNIGAREEFVFILQEESKDRARTTFLTE